MAVSSAAPLFSVGGPGDSKPLYVTAPKPVCRSACALFSGIFVIGFSYPVVPKGKARIRVQISAVHSEEDIDRCVEAFVEVGRQHGALP